MLSCKTLFRMYTQLLKNRHAIRPTVTTLPTDTPAHCSGFNAPYHRLIFTVPATPCFHTHRWIPNNAAIWNWSMQIGYFVHSKNVEFWPNQGDNSSKEPMAEELLRNINVNLGQNMAENCVESENWTRVTMQKTNFGSWLWYHVKPGGNSSMQIVFIH